MDEKQILISGPTPRQPAPSMSPLSRLRRFFLPVLGLLLVLHTIYDLSARHGSFNKFGTGHLVPLEAHIISKCPDTRVSLKITTEVARSAERRLTCEGCLAAVDPACDAADTR